MTYQKRHITVTNPKQSLRLMGAGLDVSTADHHYWIRKDPDSGKTAAPRFRFGRPTDTAWQEKGREIPAWSLDALKRAGDGILPKGRLEAILTRFPQTDEGQKDSVNALAKEIAGCLAERPASASTNGPVLRTAWPTEETGHTEDNRPQPFRKKIAAWWRQRPWAKTALR